MTIDNPAYPNHVDTRLGVGCREAPGVGRGGGAVREHLVNYYL